MKLPTPIADVLCTGCRDPATETSDDHLVYAETIVKLGGAGPSSVPLDVKAVKLQRMSDGTFAATAVVVPMCPDCHQPHELRYYLQAIGVFVRGLQGCPECNGEMELRQQDLVYEEGENGPHIRLSGDLYCPRCRSSVAAAVTCGSPPFETIASAGSLVVDLGVGTAAARPATPPGRRFGVALSFPGSHRDFVKQVAEVLATALGKDRVFYDKHFEAELARPDLDTYLQHIYHDQSQLVAIFLCADYEQRDWCHLEWRAVRDLIHRHSGEIMLLRFDEIQPAGLFAATDGFVDIGARTPQEVAALVLQRFQGRASEAM